MFNYSLCYPDCITYVEASQRCAGAMLLCEQCESLGLCHCVCVFALSVHVAGCLTFANPIPFFYMPRPHPLSPPALSVVALLSGLALGRIGLAAWTFFPLPTTHTRGEMDVQRVLLIHPG